VTSRPASTPAPGHIHWDLFLGPAPERPYAVYPDDKKYGSSKGKGAYHAFAWRGWWDFGTGALGDMACHTANMPFMALKLAHPSTISAESEEPNPETYPAWAKVVFEIPARDGLPPVTLTWYEGRKDGKRVLPSVDLLQGKEKSYSGSGSLFVGEKLTLYSPDDYGATRKLIGKDAEDVKLPEKRLARTGATTRNNDEHQKKEWVAAIKANDPKLALSNFDYAGLLTEVILLGNVAVRARKKLTYDGAAMTLGDSEMDKLLRREYRTGWKL
jgi:hypothetical protein